MSLGERKLKRDRLLQAKKNYSTAPKMRVHIMVKIQKQDSQADSYTVV